MKGRAFVLLPCLTLVAGPLLAPAASAAPCRLCDTPAAGLEEESESLPIKLEVQARLDFDQIILLDAGGSGTALLLPDGTSSTSGALGSLTGRAMVGSVVIRGEPGRLVQVGLPASIQLYGLAGGSIRLDSLTTDLPSVPRLDSQGSLRFRFGGKLQVEGNVEGDYRGDVPITVDYL